MNAISGRCDGYMQARGKQPSRDRESDALSAPGARHDGDLFAHVHKGPITRASIIRVGKALETPPPIAGAQKELTG